MSLVKHNQQQVAIQSRLKPNLTKASTNELLVLQEQINAEIEERIEQQNSRVEQVHEHYHFHDDRGLGDAIVGLMAVIMATLAMTVFVAVTLNQPRQIEYVPYPSIQQ